MKEFFEIVVALFIGFAILFALLWWPIYKYQDCKKVGHSTLYCAGKFIFDK